MSTENSPELSGLSNESKRPLALIAGPTASGKSDVAVGLAQAHRQRGTEAVIINADSAQVYGELAVLSARPSPKDMGGIEHRLFGTWNGAEPCSAADWARAARVEIATCHQRGALPILVGGTGLYLRTLLDGIAPIPPINPEIREAVRAMPVAEAYAALGNEDPDRAALLAPADSTRIARALEVVRSTGKPLSDWQERLEGGVGNSVFLKATVLLPEREALYDRCNARFEVMLGRGAVEEVESLIARKLAPGLPVMRAIGVADIAGYLRGEWSLADASERASQATRNYAKRQYTWFRNQPPPEWQRVSYDDFNLADLIEIILRK